MSKIYRMDEWIEKWDLSNDKYILQLLKRSFIIKIDQIFLECGFDSFDNSIFGLFLTRFFFRNHTFAFFLETLEI
jgi:hypothetical protein